MRMHLMRLVYLVLLFLHLTSSHLENVEDVEDDDVVSVEVIVNSTACSTTCGLGVKTQTLCLLKDGKMAIEEDAGTEVSEECRTRKVRCLDTWQCGLRTMTVTSGQRVELDCLGEVMETMGRFSWRVSWRYARGIISSDDSLFARFDAPQLGRVLLDPIKEENAGTYSCVVQDANFRRVKRVYWGIRVLPAGFLSLDYDSSLAQWDSTENKQNQGSTDRDHSAEVLYIMLVSLSLSGVSAGLLLLGFWILRRKKQSHLSMFPSVTV